MADEVVWRVEAGIASVMLNRPAKRNAMNSALLGALRAAFDELEERRDVRVVVVRGAGPASAPAWT
jgi:enoyl-CoA hydratase/carnithine racemase